MSRIQGTEGDVTGLITGGHVVSWDIESSIEISKYVDADTIDEDSAELAPSQRASVGIKDWSGSVTVNIDDTDPAPEEGTTGTFTGVETSGRNWSGPAVVSNVSTGVEVESEELTQYEVSFEGDGVLNRPT